MRIYAEKYTILENPLIGIKKKREKKQTRWKIICKMNIFPCTFVQKFAQFSSFGKLNIKRNTNSKIENSKISSLNNFNSGISTIPFYQFCLIRKQNKWKTHGGRGGGGRRAGEGGGKKYIFTYRARWINKATSEISLHFEIIHTHAPPTHASCTHQAGTDGRARN